MKIGELASQTGMAPSAIRFYEQSGLLPKPERGANGYRVYAPTAVGRLRMLQMAQNLGFSLDTVRSVLADHAGFRKEDLFSKLDARLGEIEQLMAALQAQREDLLTLRFTLGQMGETGECIDVATLAQNMMARPVLPRGPKRGARG